MATQKAAQMIELFQRQLEVLAIRYRGSAETLIPELCSVSSPSVRSQYTSSIQVPLGPNLREAVMGDQRVQPTADSPEIVAFASRMYDAARKGDTAIFEQALPAGLPPNMTNDKGDSLLMLSTYHGHLPLSRLLLSHGADPNRLNDRGQSPLAGAVFKGEGEIVDLLLAAGADVDLGKPSAAEAVALFKKADEYSTKFEEARERLRKKREGGIGGTKGAFEMM